MLRVSLLILVLALPASACLNDSEISRAEGEFRARYAGGPAAAATSSRTTIIGGVLVLGLVGSGIGLIWWRRARRA